MSINGINQGSPCEQPSMAKSTLAIGAGVVSLGIIRTKLNTDILDQKDKHLNSGLDTNYMREKINRALSQSGMKNKGVKILDFARYEKNPPKRMISSNKPTIKDFIHAIVRRVKFNDVNIAHDGYNSFYVAKSNKILINTNKQSLAGFHEIGHAINNNSSKFWRTIIKTRGLTTALPFWIAAIAICKRKKAEGETSTGAMDSATTFIKNNAGVLSLASSVPLIAEELKASQRGNKLAKELLSPDIAQKVIKSNRLGAMTYIVGAGAMALATVAGSKIRDFIA